MCFVSLILNDTSGDIQTYVTAITYASIVPYMLLKIVITIYFLGFFMVKLKPREKEESKEALAIKQQK